MVQPGFRGRLVQVESEQHLQSQHLLPGEAHRVAVLELVQAAHELHQNGARVAHREDVLAQSGCGPVVVHVNAAWRSAHTLHFMH